MHHVLEHAEGAVEAVDGVEQVLAVTAAEVLFGALDRGYDCTIISDAHTTSTLEYPDGHRIEASDIVREFNTMMQWERYPGRTNAATPLAEVRFRALAASQLRASP